MGSLGGDINATFVNPAGLGFYKTGEFVLSPGLTFLKIKLISGKQTTRIIKAILLLVPVVLFLVLDREINQKLATLLAWQ